MTDLSDFLCELLDSGIARVRGRTVVSPVGRAMAEGMLASAYRLHALDVAGPPLAISLPAALAAADWFATACWFLVHRADPADEVERALQLPPPPRSPADHLSADVIFRFLPALHRRARAVAPRDVLVQKCEAVLLRWPLAYVLADLDAQPEGPVDFHGHFGLQLLYAERLAARPRQVALVTGPTRDAIDLVFARREIRIPAGGPT